MCGICGIALPAGSTRRLDAPLIERMRDVMTHRGPDGCGLFLEEGIGLGHRRLSIVDVAGGHQPMASADGRLQIVYNGEVYNHPVLMPELQAAGYSYRTHCDTETVLHVYESDGKAAPARLRGMFAFAIWDRARHELFLARDRFGVKPLYYVHTPDGALYFASEIKALLAAGAVSPALNLAGFPDYLANHAPSGDETLFEGVRRLPAGHTLHWRDGRITIERYWDVSYAEDPALDDRSDVDLTDEFRDRFREAVRIRLMADVPLGVFLSGGIDSAAITAMMAPMVGEPVKTFSVAFAEREANELAFARLVSDRFRTDHHEVTVNPDQFFGALPSMIWHEDEPLAHPSSIALNFVARLAAERVKVVLTGEGSDETLAGYGRYRTTIHNLALSRQYQRIAGARTQRAVRGVIDRLPSGSRLRNRMRRTGLYLPADLDTLYFDNFAVFGRARQAAMLSSRVLDQVGALDPYAHAHAALAACDGTSLLDRLLYSDTKTYLHELLMKQDQMSMAASIESRVPFLDHTLVEFASRLPDRMKLRGATTKYVLREAMKGLLPPEILTRRKMGFPVPVGAWFRGSHRAYVDEFVLGSRARARGLFDPAAVRRIVDEHQAADTDHSEQMWALVNLEIWQRIFLDGEAPAGVGS